MNLSSKNSASFLSESRPEDEIDFTDYSAPYMSGHGFSLRCHRWFSPNLPALGVNPTRDNPCIYVKPDHLEQFFKSGLVPNKFALVTHNSDFIIGEKHLEYLNDQRLTFWLAMNKGVSHPKLRAIPDGLQNACWSPYGNPQLLNAFEWFAGQGLNLSRSKSEMFYANFTIDSRFNTRAKCVAMFQPQGIPLHGRTSAIEYFLGISNARFIFCPAGSGIDSCRPWEALYLKSIPIVAPSYTVAEHSWAPFVVLDEWNEESFRKAAFSVEKYEKTWNDFNQAALRMDDYCARLSKQLGVTL